jgi:hypothetical protein
MIDLDHSIIFPSEHYSYRGVGDLTIIIWTGALARGAGWDWLGALVNRLVTSNLTVGVSGSIWSLSCTVIQEYYD